MVVRTRRVFMVAAFVLAAVAFGVAPAMWRGDWSRSFPLWAAAYLSPATGSQFPLFPWAGFVLMGAGMGQIYARWGAAHLVAFANWGLLLPGVALTVFASSMSVGPSGPGPDQFGWVTGQIVMRTGVCLVILGLVAHATEYVDQLPRVFGAVAQESLVVYFVHLCVVYGSVWNNGLYRYYGESLTPAASVLIALVVVVPMVVLAWQWNALKHARPRAARLVSIAIAAVLVGRLLV